MGTPLTADARAAIADGYARRKKADDDRKAAERRERMTSASVGEKIVSIGQFEGWKNPHGGYSKMAGFLVRTDRQTIRLAIDDESSCCEDWGYFLSEDDTAKFVGAELRAITVTDTNRTGRTFSTSSYGDDEETVYLDEGDVLFVDLETDHGVLQFVAYNGHNGYYGHEALIVSEQLKFEVVL